MPHHYSDRTRELDPTALPDVEVFYVTLEDTNASHEKADDIYEPGWYWWSCFPGCMPDGDPFGPFETEGDALADARDN